MKKIVALFLVVIMAFMFAACAAKPVADTPKEEAPAKDAEEAAKPAPEKEEAPAAESDKPFAGRKLTISYSSSENNDAYQAVFTLLQKIHWHHGL